MSALAVTLVLISAVLHATWNFLAKRSGGGASFVFLVAAFASLIYAPVAVGVVVMQNPAVDWTAIGFMAGTAVLHVGYFLSLQKGYETSDLSLMYPLARGTGPLLASVGAIVLYDERPSPIAAAGIVLVAAGALSLSRSRSHRPGAVISGLVLGVITGVLIAAYTLWDT